MRIVIKRILISGAVLLYFFCPTVAWSQTPQPLTLDEALGRAVSKNPQIQAAKAQLGVYDAGIITAGTRINPNLMSDNGVAEKTYRLGIEKTFELGGKRKHRIAVAKSAREVALAEVQTTMLNTRTQVRRVYTQLYNLQQQQINYGDMLRTMGRLLDTAQKQESQGKMDSIEFLQAKIQLLKAQNTAEGLAYDLNQAQSSLNSLLNQPINTPLTLFAPNTLPRIPGPASTLVATLSGLDSSSEQLAEWAWNNRPEAEENRRALEVTRQQLQLAYSNRTPNLSLVAGPDMVTGSPHQVSIFVMGYLQLPLLNRQQGPIQEALARQAQLEQGQVSLKNQITLEVTQACNDLMLNRNRISRYENDILPTAKKLLQLSQQRFETGNAQPVLAMNAYQIYGDTLLAYQQILLDYQDAISDLERAFGSGL